MFRFTLVLFALVGLFTSLAQAQPAISKAALEAAKPLTVENLTEPVKTNRLHGQILVPHPDGQGWDYLLFYKYKSEQTQVFVIDMKTGQATKHLLKNGYATPWGHSFAPDGRVFISFWPGGGAVVMVYDPATKKLIDLGKVTSGAASTEQVTCSPDGQIFVSTFNQVHAVQIDPATLKVTDLGLQGPKREYLAYGYSIAADKDYVYTAAGKIPWTLVAYNRKTGQQEILLTTTGGNHLGVSQGKYGCTASINHLEGPDKGKQVQYWLYQGKAIEKKNPAEAPPWKVPADATANTAANVKPDIFLERAVPDPDGKAEFWYRLPADKAALPKNVPADSTPEQLGWKRIALQVEVVPIQTNRLYEMPDGRLFGTVDSYQGHFIFDPKTGQSQYLGRISLSHYGTTVADGKIYLSGYPSSPLYEYDSSKPWTFGHGSPVNPAPAEIAKESNPRRLLYFTTLIQTHHLRYLVTAADGKIYGGGHAERAHVGGGLGWWDPKTQKAEGLREPFALFDVAGLCTADGGRKVVYSSQTVQDPATKQRPSQAKLFVFDVEQQKIVKEFEPLPDAGSTGMVVEGQPGKILGAAPGKKDQGDVLYQVDVASGKVDFVRQVEGKFGGDYRKGPDGMIWTFIDGILVRIDPSNGTISLVGKVGQSGRMAFAGKDLYLAGDAKLRKIVGVVK